ncbi:MAG TPA: hypothetical protein VEI26_05070 [Terriglobales bacterium]|nr:hypothetical protein [Terriglobales bacterium]
MRNSTLAFPSIRARSHRRVLLLLIVCTFCGCNRQSTAEYKATVVGDWEEAHGTHETLHFKADGSLAMDSPSEHRSCTYDFPDTKHIRLDCASFAPQVPHVPTTYGFALDNDKLMISDSFSTGTYTRTQSP